MNDLERFRFHLERFLLRLKLIGLAVNGDMLMLSLGSTNTVYSFHSYRLYIPVAFCTQLIHLYYEQTYTLNVIFDDNIPAPNTFIVIDHPFNILIIAETFFSFSFSFIPQQNTKMLYIFMPSSIHSLKLLKHLRCTIV